MLKSSEIIFYLIGLITFIVGNCESASILDMFTAESCPEYSSQPNLSLPKVY